MKARKYIVLAALAVMVAALALVGCSSGGSSSAASSASGSGSASAASESASGSEASSSAASSAASAEMTLVTEGKITVIASQDFPPFEFIDEQTGEATGFSVDLITAMAKEMGLEAEYLPTMSFDTIIATIQAGAKADIGMSSFTVTDKRKEQVDFTDTYMNSNQSIVLPKGAEYTDYLSYDWKGKKVAVQSGTTGEDWARENLPDAEVVPMDECTVIFSALGTPQADAVVLDLPVAQYYVSKSYPDASIVEEIPTGEKYGIAVNKDNPALTAALNEALAKVIENGTYDQLCDKYGIDPASAR